MFSYQKNNLTQYESDCIRFYMGDSEFVKRGVFKGGVHAYNTINALLHYGIQNELDLIQEGRDFDIEDQEHLKSYIELIISIYNAMVKYASSTKLNQTVTYRIDRYSTIESMREKHFIEGFFSTCKYGYLKEYAKKKVNVVLLEIHRKKEIPFLDFEDIFKEYYAKPEEAEVLLPFQLHVDSIEEVELSNDECELFDLNGNKPAGKYRIYLGCHSFDYESSESIYDEITSDETIQRIKKCFIDLKENQKLNENDHKFYTKWKQEFISYILFKAHQTTDIQ